MRVKKFYMSLAALAVVVSGIALFGFLNTNSEAAIPRDCDNNAIIKCGSETASELAKDYKANKSELSKIYSSYGITESEVLSAGSKSKMGRVYKDGTVKVDGKVVATNAYSIGRENFGSSKKITIGGKTYYERSTKTSFVTDSISAFVFFDANGDFKAAILTACGNPVRATKPVYTCENLTKTAVAGYRNRYQLVAKASAKNGANIDSYTFDMGDGTKKTAATSNTSANYTHQYTKPGNYTAKVTVKVKINNSYYKETTSKSCAVPVTVTAPSYACTSLALIDQKKNTVTLKASATASNGAEVTGYNYDFGDGETKDNASATETHTYEKAGEYTAKVAAVVTIDGKETKEVSGENCEVKIVVKEEAKYACKQLTVEQIDRTNFKFDTEYTAEHADFKSLEYVIRNADGDEIARVAGPDYTQETAGTYSVQAYVTFTVDGKDETVTDENCMDEFTVNPEECKPGIPVGDERCEEQEECKPGIPVGDERCEDECKPGVPEGDEKCEELPAELPTTGPAETIGGIIGLGSLVAAGYYWYASRRGLMSEMLNR
jgi:hypothetical protein